MGINKWISTLTRGLLYYNDENISPIRRHKLRRNMIVLMIVVTIVPITVMAAINYHQYQTELKNETINPLRIMSDKTRHSFELLLEERLSTVKFIASAYRFEELSNTKTLSHILLVLKKEFGGFVDLGVIDDHGIQVSYCGPYELLGKNYSEQSWFQEAQLRGEYVSDVFMGYRKFPHIAVAAQHLSARDKAWTLRATIDTYRFDNLISSMELDPKSDAFLINREGIFQTNSKFYGKILEHCPFLIPQTKHSGTSVIETKDPRGVDVFLAYNHFMEYDYTLVAIKPHSVVLKSWYTLKNKMFFIFIVSIVVIILVIIKLTGILVRQIREAVEKRESALRELEHSHKLSSIGRLAAGVAHEINNPMAIINEKAGLMKDIVEFTPDFKKKAKLLELTESIIQSVERCKTITHRLLGFARRLEVLFEVLDLNKIIKEVIGFLEREALYRKINLNINLADDLPHISSDRGQLQQVFLNILTNAFAAVEDGGQITITTWDNDADTVGVSIRDNGCGMSEDVLHHIFEPFFTTKKGTGTGLGLPITYGIVKKLGGDFKVQSQEREGTTFTVYLLKKPKNEQGG